MIEAADSMSGVAQRVRDFDQSRLTSVMTLTGLSGTRPCDPGPAPFRKNQRWHEIHRLGWPGSPPPQSDVVVLFPARIGSYPYRSLEGVLYHEVAHVLIGRAAAGAPVPRWFNEGLASAAERSWGLEARTRFAWEILAGDRLTATQLEGLFGQGPREVARAYVLADALVRHLLEDYGPAAPACILARMADGQTFAQALNTITGTSVRGVMGAFLATPSGLGIVDQRPRPSPSPCGA